MRRIFNSWTSKVIGSVMCLMMLAVSADGAKVTSIEGLAEGADHLLDEAIPSLERVMIRAALEQTDGHRQEAARLLGWGRNTLTRKIKELGMDAEAG